jgi:photosystem II stability/assembly factor-like uncharacterized protein
MRSEHSPLQWRPTNAARERRHDDLWFLDAETGWTVNSDGKILKTADGGASWQRQFHTPRVWLRCVGFANAQRGWVGTTTPANPLYETHNGGETWTPVANLPAAAPPFICGLSVVNEAVIYGSGTNNPEHVPGLIKSADGGRTWTALEMGEHASLLVDLYFPEPDRGWVVGGKANQPNPTTRSRVKPVVLYTEDGGRTWANLLAGMESQFPPGEWGWKIFFVNDRVGYVSLENFSAGAILKTTDGGKSWVRKPVNDPQGNKNLEGIGFLDEERGWVGGWGDAAFSSGFSSATSDGAESWRDANEIGRFLNRFRFLGNPVAVGYAAGDTIYKYSAEPVPAPPVPRAAPVGLLAARGSEMTGRPAAIAFRVPAGAKRLSVNVWDHYGVHVREVIDQPDPAAGPGSVAWDGRTDAGEPAPPGYYVYRVSIDDDSESRVLHLAP